MNGLSGYREQPWRAAEWRLLVAGQVAGLALVLVGWVQASGDVRPKGQIGSLNVGIAGAALAVAAGVRFLARGRHAVAERQHVVVRTLHESTAPASSSAIELRPVPAIDARDALLSAPTMTRFHRPGCLLVAGKPVAPSSVQTHEMAGRRPCGVCTP
jgi:hypothetical protein